MALDEESVIGFDALYESMLKCRKGVLWKDSVAAYYHRGAERTERLSRELKAGTYKASPPRHFTITSPKPREIESIAFRDRVYQRSLNDKVIYPEMTKSFILCNFACQNGKGTDPAREMLKEFLHRHYRKHGADGYVAQLDVHGYYPNMRHDKAEENFRRKLPDWAYRRAAEIMRTQYEGEIGYKPGSQIIQIQGISMLDRLDHYIKEQLHVKLYIRYMDDLIMIHEDRKFLEDCLVKVIDQLSELGFSPNPKKTRVYELKEGITFLGFRYRLTETGKVVMNADPKKVKSARRKYRRLIAKAKRGEVPKESVDASFNTWIDHLSKGNSYRLIRRMKEYYNDLWKGEENGTDRKEENHVASGNGEDGKRGSTGCGKPCKH